MLDFTKFKQFNSLSEIKTLKGDQIIEIPKQYTDSISLWSLIDSASKYALADSIEIAKVHDNKTTEDYATRMSGNLDSVLNVIVIDSTFNVFYTFEDESSLKEYLDQFSSDQTSYLKINDAMTEELIEKTRQDRIYQCNRDLALKRYKLKLLQQSIEDLEALKESI